VNYEQSLVLTGSFDGSFSMLAVVDKDPRKKELIPTIAPVNENVIPKVERDLLLK
jgi:hypothetical protein